jgi:ribose 5-phosphate isomerase
MFGDNYNSGTLQATPTSNSDYNTTGTFVTDSKGNFVLDSAGNEILSSDYKNKRQQGSSKNTNTSGLYVTDSKGNFVLDPNGNKIKSQDYMTSINYVPALDAPYPKLQSQLGKAAYDIRGIPDTPLSTAPVTGISGRPVV